MTAWMQQSDPRQREESAEKMALKIIFSQKRNISILFFGTDSFSLHHLKAIQNSSLITRLETVVPPKLSKNRSLCIFFKFFSIF